MHKTTTLLVLKKNLTYSELVWTCHNIHASLPLHAILIWFNSYALDRDG